MTDEGRTDVEVWLAFERLDHAYLVRDDDAVQRELALIDRLRDRAAEAAQAALAGPALIGIGRGHRPAGWGRRPVAAGGAGTRSGP